MFIIIGSDGNEYGPADAATIQSWISSGRATLQTKARRANPPSPSSAPEWKPLADFPEFAQQPPPIPNEARTTPVTIDAKAYAAGLIARAKPLDIGGCISRGWAFYQSDFWPILGITLLVYLILGAVPAGGLWAVGLAMAGLYYYYLGKMRGQTRQLPDIFVGLSRMTGPLIIGNLALAGIIFAIVLAMLALWAVALVAAHGINLIEGPAIVLLLVPLSVLSIIPIAYLSITLSFMFPLIIDKNLGWRDAMTVSRRVLHAQFWRYFGLTLLLAMLSFAGLLLCYVGAIFVAPLQVAATAQAYEDLCNPPEK